MADLDRDGHRDEREREHTTVIETDRGGGGGVLAVVLLIIALLVLLFLFRDQLGFGGDAAGDTTEIQVPDDISVNVN